MAENDPYTDRRDARRALVAAAAVTLGFLGAAHVFGHDGDPGNARRPDAHEKKAPPSHDGHKNHLKIATIQGLEIGGKLTDVPVLTLEHGTDRRYRYVPREKRPAEDLVVIYSPALDRMLKERDRNRFGDDQADSFSTAFLFTSVPGGVMESLVAFNDKTEVIDDIYSGPGGLLPPEGTVPLYDSDSFPPERVGFTMDVKQIPSPDGSGVELSVHGVQPDPGPVV